MRFLTLLLLCLPGVLPLKAAETPKIFNTQELTIPLLEPIEALKAITVPKGFRVQLSAAEPMVRQPIAMAWDVRGRLWVAECYTYAERETNFEKKL